MAPIGITFALITLFVAIVLGAVTAGKLRWAHPVVVAALFAVVAVYNYLNPNEVISLSKRGWNGICQTSASRLGLTTPNSALPPEMTDGVQAVEPTHQFFDWFCGK
ncbi:hypothetical protein [Pseudaminobacter salicylatoxidans]|uniref:hypothetical protein n=1 Tax=Pseudaminobacter salicylatoxidans TaxID=93369 RepID=UPI001AECDCE5|nr:hypothetical protein [Pseudaminobacter salicylatoxidans]